jgi:hypothetical protein
MAAKLRPGNVSSADDWEDWLVPEIHVIKTISRKRGLASPEG